MDISVIIPTFNSQDTIVETLQSIIKQKTKYKIEIIITDDCSSDNTVRIIQKIQKTTKNINLYVNKENKGPAYCRNNGITNSSGRYLMFCDSDDMWMPCKVERQIDYMQQHKIPMSCSFYLNFKDMLSYGAYEKFKQYFGYSDLLSYNYIGTSTVCIDQNFFDNISFPNIRRRQDYALWLDLAKKVDTIHCIQEILTYRRLLKSSVSSSKLRLIKYNFDVLNKQENIPAMKSICLIFLYAIKKILNLLFNTKKLLKDDNSLSI